MDETDLLADPAISPGKRQVIEEAFEAAWSEIQNRFLVEEDRKYARRKLAGILRMIARQQIVSAQHLADAALIVFRRHVD